MQHIFYSVTEYMSS